MGLGFVAVVFGWYGASHSAYLFQEIPYLISGGLLGVALVTGGGFLFFCGLAGAHDRGQPSPRRAGGAHARPGRPHPHRHRQRGRCHDAAASFASQRTNGGPTTMSAVAGRESGHNGDRHLMAAGTGRRRTRLAATLMALGPGAHRLRLEAERPGVVPGRRLHPERLAGAAGTGAGTGTGNSGTGAGATVAPASTRWPLPAAPVAPLVGRARRWRRRPEAGPRPARGAPPTSASCNSSNNGGRHRRRRDGDLRSPSATSPASPASPPD